MPNQREQREIVENTHDRAAASTSKAMIAGPSRTTIPSTASDFGLLLLPSNNSS